MSRRRLYLGQELDEARHPIGDFTLPYDALSDTIATLANREAGKSYAMKVLAEIMWDLKQQLVVFDPVSHWWGLRTAANGRDPGLPIPIFGGPHGDIPLEPTAGKLMAEMVADGLSVIFDLKPWSKSARRRFVTDFCEHLMTVNEHLVRVVLEECHQFVPQRPVQGDHQMLGAASDLTTTGRGIGITTTLISQRSARVHKDPLEQTDILIAMRTGGKNDRAAIQGWINVNVGEKSSYVDAVMSSLPKLQVGQAWVWAPQYFDEPHLIQFDKLKTFDSSATPKPGQRRRRVKTVADIDLGDVSERMTEMVERAKENDPTALKRELAQARQELRTVTGKLEQRDAAFIHVSTRCRELIEELKAERQKVKEVPALAPKHFQRLETLTRQLDAGADKLGVLSRSLMEIAGTVDSAVTRAKAAPAPAREKPPQGRPASATAPPARSTMAPAEALSADAREDGLTDYSRVMIEALAARHPYAPTRAEWAMIAKRSSKSSKFLPAIRQLLLVGYVEQSPTDQRFRMTARGLEQFPGSGAAPETPDELAAMWVQNLPDYQSVLFRTLYESDHAMDKQELSEQSGRSLGSSKFAPSLRSLVRQELVEENAGLYQVAAFFRA